MTSVRGLIFVTVAAILGSGQALFAAPVENPVVHDSSCIQNSQDAYDLGWRMTTESQSFAGRCVDASTKRPVSVVKETSSTVKFANFFHAGEFWVAEWSKNDQPKMDFLIVHFDSGVPLLTAGHTEIRFRFPQGLRLTSQTTGRQTVVNDVIVDWEATFVMGEAYNPFVGLNKNYALSGRLLSTSSRIKENIVAPGVLRRVDQYAMGVSKSVATVIFWEFIYRSQLRGHDYFYLTIKRNCTTELFAIVDPVLKRAGLIDPNLAPFKTYPMVDPIIGPSYRALEVRGLIAPQQPRSSFAAEFGLAEEK